MVNSFQGIPPIAPPQGLQFPTTQIPHHPVNPGIPQPGELHTGYHSMAPHQGSQFQTTQLPSYPVNSSIQQLEKMYTGYHFNQQTVKNVALVKKLLVVNSVPKQWVQKVDRKNLILNP
ncbi:hypothetical protein ACOMHN_029364 [Nucella lapillus]